MNLYRKVCCYSLWPVDHSSLTTSLLKEGVDDHRSCLITCFEGAVLYDSGPNCQKYLCVLGSKISHRAKYHWIPVRFLFLGARFVKICRCLSPNLLFLLVPELLKHWKFHASGCKEGLEGRKEHKAIPVNCQWNSSRSPSERERSLNKGKKPELSIR